MTDKKIVYYKDPENGNKVFTVSKARKISQRLNEKYSKLGMVFKVRRTGMDSAMIEKEISKGGIEEKPFRRVKRCH